EVGVLEVGVAGRDLARAAAVRRVAVGGAVREIEERELDAGATIVSVVLGDVGLDRVQRCLEPGDAAERGAHGRRLVDRDEDLGHVRVVKELAPVAADVAGGVARAAVAPSDAAAAAAPSGRSALSGSARGS